MRQKELRVALICYGGISLAVYMHGVTKEVWRATRASRSFIAGEPAAPGVEQVYRRLFETIAGERSLRLRLLTDVVGGASAGGMNAVFLAQAIASGQSLEPLTRLWLEKADVDELFDPDARPWSRFTKFWAQPLAWFMLSRPDNVVSSTVAPETREEVRAKVSRLIRARWFAPPFSGIGFSRLIADALAAMAGEAGDGSGAARRPLLPGGHPLDLFVTATDFNGHPERLRLHSPPVVEESEHRLVLSFQKVTEANVAADMAVAPELVLAARATASFPGAFPPLTLAEIDRLVEERGLAWPGRSAFLPRIMPAHARRGELGEVALIDGSVLVNAPFNQAIAVLTNRPAQREVDRRIVYIDPKPKRSRLPDEAADGGETADRSTGFLAAIVGALSTIPREQPIRDNLEAIREQSRERAEMRAVVEALRPEVEEAVEALFGRTLFLDFPTPKRLAAWRNKAQQAAAERAGYAFHGYAEVKAGGIVVHLAGLIAAAAPEVAAEGEEALIERLWDHLRESGLRRLASAKSGATPQAIDFFRRHDLGFRIRRLRLLSRRLARDWNDLGELDSQQREVARETVFKAQSLYFAREPVSFLGPEFVPTAARVMQDPGPALRLIAEKRALSEADVVVDGMLVQAIATMPRALRRRVLLAYLGFPFYDVATLPLLRGEGLTEYDPVKVDRISPEDCSSIRPGGTDACLRGTEFFSFGAFFSRAYRENDYLWGRLHGAERMIDLIASAVEQPLAAETVASFKRDAFLAVLGEERGRLTAEPDLIDGLEREVLAAFAGKERDAPGAAKAMDPEPPAPPEPATASAPAGASGEPE
jgi:patatin-related protein